MAKKEATLDNMLSDGRLMKGDDPRLEIHRIPFGMPDIDTVLNGGIPRHRITIINGEYSSGKSFLLQLFMKHAVEQELQVAYIDTEQTYDPVWWNQCGLPLDKLLVSQPNIGEDAVEVAVGLVKAGVDVVAIDSLAALIPFEEAEEDDAKRKFIGLQARLISKLFRLMLSTKHNSAVVCTNQLRDAIGGPSPTEVMPGGKAQGFLASLIVRTQRVGWIEEKNERIGFNMRIIARKSKVGRPFGECVLPFLYRGEIDVLSMLIDRGIESGLIMQKGPYYELRFGENGGGERILGRNSVISKLQENESLKDHLRKALGER